MMCIIILCSSSRPVAFSKLNETLYLVYSESIEKVYTQSRNSETIHRVPDTSYVANKPILNKCFTCELRAGCPESADGGV